MLLHELLLTSYRKRAKTDAEKEQRRIERVLRNRAAAQSSRERKRQEVEALEAEKREVEDERNRLNNRVSEVETENSRLQRQLREMAKELSVFKKVLGGQGASTDEQESLLKLTEKSSPSFSQMSFDSGVNVKSEFDTEMSFSSFTSINTQPPHSAIDPNAIMSSPSAQSMNDPTATILDLTQQPAELLCDLQCQSRITRLQWDHSTMTTEKAMLVAYHTLATLSQLSSLMMTSTISLAATMVRPEISNSSKTESTLQLEMTRSPNLSLSMR
jgi:transcriptional activator HAC1